MQKMWVKCTKLCNKQAKICYKKVKNFSLSTCICLTCLIIYNKIIYIKF